MTPEEINKKSEELYFYRPDAQLGFVKGANWMAEDCEKRIESVLDSQIAIFNQACTRHREEMEEKDKEIAKLESALFTCQRFRIEDAWSSDNANHPLRIEVDKRDAEIAALMERIETLKDEFTKGYDYCKEYYKITD